MVIVDRHFQKCDFGRQFIMTYTQDSRIVDTIFRMNKAQYITRGISGEWRNKRILELGIDDPSSRT